MPTKKKEVKQEAPAFIDEVGTFVHEQECARYRGGIRRFGVVPAPSTTNTSGGGASNSSAGASGRGNKGGGNTGSNSGRRGSVSNSLGAGSVSGGWKGRTAEFLQT